MVEGSRGGGIDSLKALGVYFRQLVLRHKKIADTHQLVRSGAALDAGCQKSLTEVLGHLCGVSGEVAHGYAYLHASANHAAMRV